MRDCSFLQPKEERPKVDHGTQHKKKKMMNVPRTFHRKKSSRTQGFTYNTKWGRGSYSAHIILADGNSCVVVGVADIIS